MSSTKEKRIEIPFYCKECGKCKLITEILENLKIINSTGYTHDVYCKKLNIVAYRI